MKYYANVYTLFKFNNHKFKMKRSNNTKLIQLIIWIYIVVGLSRWCQFGKTTLLSVFQGDEHSENLLYRWSINGLSRRCWFGKSTLTSVSQRSFKAMKVYLENLLDRRSFNGLSRRCWFGKSTLSSVFQRSF